MKVEKIEGIKSVDFKIVAKGHGVVNWNGPTNLMLEGERGMTANNHTMPKLRGYSNLSGKVKEDTGYKYRKEASDIDFSKTPLYISANAVRFHMFKDDGLIDINKDEVKENVDKLLCSLTGLVRGYVIAGKEYKRTSALLLEDLVDQLGNGNFEQMTKAGSKEKQKTKKGDEASNSLFSKTTFGDTLYEGYGSISIEQLQFIPVSDDFSRNAIKLNNDKDGENLALKITDFLKQLNPEKSPLATYNKNYVRRGSIYNYGEAGILLNNDAIDTLVNKTIELIENLIIRQGRGYMYVDSLEVDYNDSSSAKNMMRIKTGSGENNPSKQGTYAVYFEAR